MGTTARMTRITYSMNLDDKKIEGPAHQFSVHLFSWIKCKAIKKLL